MQNCKGCGEKLMPNTLVLAMGDVTAKQNIYDVEVLINAEYYCNKYCLIKEVKDLITKD